jgi:hypothetical protein
MKRNEYVHIFNLSFRWITTILTSCFLLVIQLLQNALNLASSSLMWASLLLFGVYQVQCMAYTL